MTPALDTTIPSADPDKQLVVALRRRGQRVTSQRLVIHRALLELDRHVTAEQVLDAVRPRLPGVSLPTVYATLDLLEELGTVRRVSGPHGPTLYDPRAEPHHHLVCRQCGRVEDFDAAVELEAATIAARSQGFSPDRSELVVSGRCAACAPLGRTVGSEP
jgi:Fe2+ or Zn2+ uptake regulation protein